MALEEIDRAAEGVLRDNDRQGDWGRYTVPTAGLYPYQWNWDSAFAAWGFSRFDIPRAWQELETLMAAQWENGMVPHIIFHKVVPEYFPGPDVWGAKNTPPTSGISQPPIAATMARAVYEADKAVGLRHIERMYHGLLRWHRWFMEARVDDGMVAVTHPWESGRDNAPDWDEGMAGVDTSGVGDYKRRDTSHVDNDMRPTKEQYDRYLALVYFGRGCGWNDAEIRRNGPFRVADPGMTFILLRANRDLRALAEELVQPTTEIDLWIERLEKGAARHWNAQAGHYDSIELRSGEFTGVRSNASFLCWYAGIDDARALDDLDRMLNCVTYPVASIDPAREDFDHLRYWRGPTWGIVNALIAIGLEECGHGARAADLREKTRALIVDKGFSEYFSPLDGTRAGGGHFTWTAAIWLTWASPQGKGRFF